MASDTTFRAILYKGMLGNDGAMCLINIMNAPGPLLGGRPTFFDIFLEEGEYRIYIYNLPRVRPGNIPVDRKLEAEGILPSTHDGYIGECYAIAASSTKERIMDYELMVAVGINTVVIDYNAMTVHYEEG